MKHLNSIALVTSLVTLGLSSQAFAAGFGVNERSALATGRANAVYAKLKDPGTLFYNPAGLADVEGFQLSIGGQFIVGTQRYEDPAGERAGADGKLLKPIPNFAITYQFTDWLTVGTGLAVPHGLAVSWPDDFAGKSIVRFVELKAPHVTLGAGFKVLDELSIGVAGYFAFTQLELERDLAGNSVTIESHPLFKNDGDGLGFSGSIGVQYRPTDDLHFGVAYKHKMDLSYDDGRFILTNTDGDKLIEALTTTTITLPGQVDIAAGYDITDDIYLEFDATWMQWSVLEELALYFSELDEDCGEGCSNQPIAPEQIQDLSWEDVWFLRAGVDWQVNDSVQVSGGLGYDFNPVPDSTLSPLLPDSDRFVTTLGGSYKLPWMPLYVDASYLLVYFMPREVNGIEEPTPGHTIRFRAKYDSMAHLFGLNLRYVFGDDPKPAPRPTAPAEVVPAPVAPAPEAAPEEPATEEPAAEEPTTEATPETVPEPTTGATPETV